MHIDANDQATFCLVLACYFTSCYKLNSSSHYNSFNVQLWPKFQSGDSFTRND